MMHAHHLIRNIKISTKLKQLPISSRRKNKCQGVLYGFHPVALLLVIQSKSLLPDVFLGLVAKIYRHYTH